ncbi:hypothetical protein ZWY2020_009714 [Hordeum vulgare]|nr:hypothetical protein ZWY2020_009714 [Hordeum vulgare]
MAFTRTRSRASGPAAARTAAMTVAFEMAYARIGEPKLSTPMTLAVQRMQPPRRPGAMTRAPCLMHATADRALTAITRSKSARSRAPTEARDADPWPGDHEAANRGRTDA